MQTSLHPISPQTLPFYKCNILYVFFFKRKLTLHLIHTLAAFFITQEIHFTFHIKNVPLKWFHLFYVDLFCTPKCHFLKDKFILIFQTEYSIKSLKC